MFEILANKRVLAGENSLDEIASILGWYRIKKPFLVIYNRNSPVFEKIEGICRDNAISPCVYQVRGEPDIEVINRGGELYREEQCDGILAVGGGSAMDAAKAIALLANNEGKIEEYQMGERAVQEPAALVIAVPTTAGTGSEATKVSVLTNTHNGLKKSVYHHSMAAELVILDPVLSVTLSPAMTASTAMDALSHAVESYVSLNATPISEMYSLKAAELIFRNLEKVIRDPGNLQARMNMLTGSYLAGLALNAGIGITHIIAQPLGALLHIPHGNACSILLTPGMRMNIEYAAKKYKQLGLAMGLPDRGKGDMEMAAETIAEIEALRTAIGAPHSLAAYMKPEISRQMILDTIQRTTGHIRCNPRPVDQDMILETLRLASL